MRVGSALRSTEIKPLFPDLFWTKKKRKLFSFFFYLSKNSNQPRAT